jgi:hypothetical protein
VLIGRDLDRPALEASLEAFGDAVQGRSP